MELHNPCVFSSANITGSSMMNLRGIHSLLGFPLERAPISTENHQLKPATTSDHLQITGVCRNAAMRFHQISRNDLHVAHVSNLVGTIWMCSSNMNTIYILACLCHLERTHETCSSLFPKASKSSQLHRDYQAHTSSTIRIYEEHFTHINPSSKSPPSRISLDRQSF